MGRGKSGSCERSGGGHGEHAKLLTCSLTRAPTHTAQDLGWAGVVIYLLDVSYGCGLLLYAFLSFELAQMPPLATNLMVIGGFILTLSHMLYKYQMSYTHDELIGGRVIPRAPLPSAAQCTSPPFPITRSA